MQTYPRMIQKKIFWSYRGRTWKASFLQQGKDHLKDWVSYLRQTYPGNSNWPSNIIRKIKWYNILLDLKKKRTVSCTGPT